MKNRYGICYEDGVIKIRLRHAVTGRPLRYSSLVSTLCHELAHLRYFNHGVRFRVFNMELLEFAREQGIYRPGRRGSNSEDALVGEQRGGATGGNCCREWPETRRSPAGSAFTFLKKKRRKVGDQELS